MLGLIIKDFLYFRRNTRLFAVLVVMYIIMGVSMNSVGAMSGMVSMLGLIFVLNSFSTDEAAHWDEYGLTLPVSRRDAVRARYLVGLILMALCLGLVALSAVVLCALSSDLTLSEELGSALFTPMLMLLVSAATMPLCYKYGIEKGRMVMMAIMMVLFLGIFGGVALLRNSAPVQTPGATLPPAVLPIAIAISLALYYLSYRVSVHVYTHREF